MSTGIVQEESGMPTVQGAPHEDAPAVLDNMEVQGKETVTEPKELSAAEKEAVAAAAAKKAATTIKIPSIMASSVSLSPKDPPAISSTSNAGSVESVTKAQVVSPTVEEPVGTVISPTGSQTAGSSIIIPPLANPIYSALPAQPAVPTVPTNQNSAPSSAKSGPAHPQLNDALAYLDRVKAEFHDQPEIYNKFLQIMRDFKINAYPHIPLFQLDSFLFIGLIRMESFIGLCTCSWDIRA